MALGSGSGSRVATAQEDPSVGKRDADTEGIAQIGHAICAALLGQNGHQIAVAHASSPGEDPGVVQAMKRAFESAAVGLCRGSPAGVLTVDGQAPERLIAAALVVRRHRTANCGSDEGRGHQSRGCLDGREVHRDRPFSRSFRGIVSRRLPPANQSRSGMLGNDTGSEWIGTAPALEPNVETSGRPPSGGLWIWKGDHQCQ